MTKSRSYLQTDIKRLWGLSAARCARCRVQVTAPETHADPGVVLGEIAHIAAHENDGPRADLSLTEDERRRYPNLILLCGHCHTLVDKQANTYTSEDLRQWKSEHEAWVRNRLVEEMPAVSFAELEVITAALSRSPARPESELTLISPAEKMEKNGLTPTVSLEMQVGMLKSGEVGDYLTQMSQLDPDFPERLRAGFVERYNTHFAEGLRGDSLFFALRDFASPAGGMRQQAAGLAVVVYLFERCEIFER